MYNLNSQGQQVFNISIICAVLDTTAVILRIACKFVQKNGLHLDDLWIMIGLLSSGAADACLLWGTLAAGGGKEMKEILASNSRSMYKELSNYLQGIVLSWTFYLVSSFAIKMSLLSFYRRIFDTPGYRKIALGIMILSILWFIGAIVGNFVFCIPFDYYWNRSKKGRCLNPNAYIFAIGIVEVVLDAVTLALPLRVVTGLRMPTHKKIGLTLLFLLGGFAVGTGVARVVLIYQPGAAYVKHNTANIWGNVHIMTASICACLPIYVPLWRLIARLPVNFSKFYNSRRSSSALPSFVRRVDDGSPLREVKGSSKLKLASAASTITGQESVEV